MSIKVSGDAMAGNLSRLTRSSTRQLICLSALLLAGCGGVQSALDPAGREASRIFDIFWWMTSGSVIVWLAVIALALYCARVPPEKYRHRTTKLMIVGAGALVPTAVLSVLLVYGLSPLPALVAPAPEGTLKIAVSGEQWWWRVRYLLPAGEAVVLANEIRLPAGEPVEFQLDSPDVIHSFWIPSLGGKVDMIPGRVTRLVLNPTRTGFFRGVCAEYCGASHALMRLSVVVQEKDDFVRWLADQARSAQAPADPLASQGQDAFLASGCGSCHTVRGTPADGVIGPDLTHVGSRLSVAAETLPNETDAFRRWIAATEELKPGAQMPSFHMLPPEVLSALAAYMEGLK
jgi:cytochrome c oxidase subunit 2